MSEAIALPNPADVPENPYVARLEEAVRTNKATEREAISLFIYEIVHDFPEQGGAMWEVAGIGKVIRDRYRKAADMVIAILGANDRRRREQLKDASIAEAAHWFAAQQLEEENAELRRKVAKLEHQQRKQRYA